MKRTATIALFALAAGLVGCQDLGLEGNRPLDEAVNRPPSDLVVAVHSPAADEGQELIVDGRAWVPAGRPIPLDPASLRPVGSADGKTVYARGWDRAPYDALYTPLRPGGPGTPADTLAGGRPEAGSWQAWAPVIGGAGAAPRSAAGPEPGDGTGPAHDVPDAQAAPEAPDTAPRGH